MSHPESFHKIFETMSKPTPSGVAGRLIGGFDGQEGCLKTLIYVGVKGAHFLGCQNANMGVIFSEGVFKKTAL